MQIPGATTKTAISPFWALVSAAFLFLCAAKAQQPGLPDVPKPKNNKTQPKGPSDSGWPRMFTSGVNTFTIYQPQVDKWNENLVDLYCAVELKEGTETAAKYGVVWIQARTEVDKVNRLVTLDQASVTNVKFPVAPNKESELKALLEKKLAGATRTISLDRLEAALEADSEAAKGVEGKNDPPKVIIAKKPSLLVLIDGTPQMGDVPGAKLRSVINTRSIILYDNEKQLYFLRVQDWWLQAKDLQGPWEYGKRLSDEMKRAEEIVSQNERRNPEGGQIQQQPSLKGTGKKVEFAEIPGVYGVWGNTAYSRTAAAWANPYTGNYGAATRGAYHNTQTGRSTVAGRGYNTNIYTGNTYGYRGGVTYNPNTGIVAGGGAGFVGNIYTGQGTGGRGGFIYNTNTNAGIAAGKDNVYAGKDGTVYRYNRDSGSWSVNSGNGWQPIERPQPKLQTQQQMRNKGAQRNQNFNSMRGFGGARVRGGGRRR